MSLSERNRDATLALTRPQCLDLREQLKRDPDFNDVGLWVVSPLTRALQTFLVGCPCVPRAASRPVLRTWPQGTNTAEALASAWRDAPMQSASAPATGTVTPPRPRRVPASQERASRDAAQPSIDAFFSPAGRAPSPHSGATPAMAAVAISRQRDTEAVSPPASAGAPCSPPPTGAPREAWGNGTGGESVAPGEGGMRCAARSLDVTFGSSYRERVKAVVHPAVAERLMCSGDVGRPRRVIEELFGDVMPVGSFDALPEEWWYNPHQGANCAVSQCMDRNEPEASLKQRIEVRATATNRSGSSLRSLVIRSASCGRNKQAFLSRPSSQAFKTYAMDRPERVIAVVAHSIFIKALLKSLSADGAVTLKNAEYRKIYL